MRIRDVFNVADLPQQFSEGGEAVLYHDPEERAGIVLKLFLDPGDEDFRGNPKAAVEKLSEIQTKLADFPTGLPERVIVPIDLATNPDAPAAWQVASYYMRRVEGGVQLGRYAEKPYLDEHGIDYVDNLNKRILPVFRDLHHTVSRLHEHQAGIVIGDFTDTNVLVQGTKAYLVDADSFGFGKYPARLGIPEFTDPLHNEEGAPLSPDTDWYAYAVLLVQSLLRVKPYGGTYRLNKKILRGPQRLSERLSVFQEGVTLPDRALPVSTLPDNLFEHFAAVFGKDDRRGPFPAYLLDMHWQRCRTCGSVHARSRCPSCQRLVRRQHTHRERDNLRVTPIFTRDRCRIVAAQNQYAGYQYAGGQLRYLYIENGQYWREDGSWLSVATSDDTRLPIRTSYKGTALEKVLYDNFRLMGEHTILNMTNGKGEKHTIVCHPQSNTEFLSPIAFKTNNYAMYCVIGTFLVGRDRSGKLIGGIDLSRLLELNPHCSVQFSIGEAGGMVYLENGTAVAPCRMFGARDFETGALVKCAPSPGSLVDCACYAFEGDRGWFLMTLRNGATLTNWCIVLNSEGEIINWTSAPAGSDGWLGEIHGNCTYDASLMTPTKAGIVQVEIKNKEFTVLKIANTEGFVDAQTRLLSGNEWEIYAVKPDGIMRLDFI